MAVGMSGNSPANRVLIILALTFLVWILAGHIAERFSTSTSAGRAAHRHIREKASGAELP